jgi:hypothetical protein
MDSVFRKQLFVRLILLFISIILFNPLFSQEQDSSLVGKSVSRKSLNISDLQDLTKDGFNFWQDKFSGHFAGIDFGLNTFFNKDYSGYNPDQINFMDIDIIRSNSLFINVVNQSLGIQKNRNTIGFVTGLGLQLQSYRLDKNTTIEKMPNGRIVPKTLVFDDNQKSKIGSVYLVVPLLAESQVPVKNYANRLYFSAGVYGGLRVSSHTKIKYRFNRKKEKLKTPDDFSLNDFKFGLMARMGYRWVNVFATYDLTPLFEENLGPKLTPVTFGVTLLRF